MNSTDISTCRVLGMAPSVALGALSPTSPVASVTPGRRLPPASRPRRTAPAFAVNAIETAAQKILVSSYALTAGSGIVEALVRAKQRGVDVKLIADKTTPCEYKSGIDPLTRAGVPVWIDQGTRAACPRKTDTHAIDEYVLIR